MLGCNGPGKGAQWSHYEVVWMYVFTSNKKKQEKQLFAEVKENYETLYKMDMVRQVSGLGNQSSHRVCGSRKGWRQQEQTGSDIIPPSKSWHAQVVI